MSVVSRHILSAHEAPVGDSNEKGSIMVETVMTIPFFLITMIVILKLAFFGYTVVAAQWIAQQVTREIVVQPTLSPADRSTMIETRSQQLADVLGVSQFLLPRVGLVHNGIKSCSFVPQVDMTSLPNLSSLDRKDICGSLTSTSPPVAINNAGGIGDVVVVQLRFHFGLWKYFPTLSDAGLIVTGEAIGLIEDTVV